ncbi:MAG: hypothetical protein DMG08_23560 [Acidobacteria bacterium]|nr:MAG: hypothetical protein DMG08_23560 [Acidobacteriota bacterium]PYV02788.1 MAG: hypothetical protein DMG10_13535 [Acidobacteriota bacterium]
MIFFLDILGMLVFRARALRAIGGRRSLVAAWVALPASLLTFTVIRGAANADPNPLEGVDFLASLFQLNLVQALLFLSIAYVPAVICLSNAFAGDGLGFSFSRDEYQVHVSVLFPLWGALFFAAGVLLFLVPRAVSMGILEVTFERLKVGVEGLVPAATLGILMAAYTVWAIKEINYLSTLAAVGVFVLSWFTLPLFFVLTRFLFALPFFIMIPLGYVAWQRLRGYFELKSGEQDLKAHLHSLTVNPQDADAHHQLGLIDLRRADLDKAQIHFEKAIEIDPRDPDYHYYLGRVFEEKGNWPAALEQYEQTYHLNAKYGLGDIFREVGKGYLHTGRLEKAVEFLHFFLDNRSSDPEGRYWVAVAFQKLGQTAEMRNQLRTLLDQARSNPRFFRKGNRRWLHQARMLLRQS